MINKITVIGVGLIGGSLARALKEKNLAKDVLAMEETKHVLRMLKN